MTDANPTADNTKQVKKTVRKDNNTFSMNFWEDEKMARKFMKENMLCLQQNAQNRGEKAHFSRTKDNGDGTQTMEVQFASERVEIAKDGSKKTVIEFTGNNFVRVTFDPARKFPKSDKDDGEAKKKRELPTFVKNR